MAHDVTCLERVLVRGARSALNATVGRVSLAPARQGSGRTKGESFAGTWRSGTNMKPRDDEAVVRSQCARTACVGRQCQAELRARATSVRAGKPRAQECPADATRSVGVATHFASVD